MGNSNQEVFMQDNDFLVTKTDLDSRIIYANSAFCEQSGFSEQELIGHYHNVVRHQDMPRGIYNLMWEHLQSGQEFFGYIKNVTKDGSSYWTLANVAPYFDEDTMLGYCSVRRAPTKTAIEKIVPLYKKMKQAEQEVERDQQLSVSSAVLWQAITKEYQTYAEFILSL
jgi:PAS domain S-box-containing protein